MGVFLYDLVPVLNQVKAGVDFALIADGDAGSDSIVAEGTGPRSATDGESWEVVGGGSWNVLA